MVEFIFCRNIRYQNFIFINYLKPNDKRNHTQTLIYELSFQNIKIRVSNDLEGNQYAYNSVIWNIKIHVNTYFSFQKTGTVTQII